MIKSIMALIMSALLMVTAAGCTDNDVSKDTKNEAQEITENKTADNETTDNAAYPDSENLSKDETDCYQLTAMEKGETVATISTNMGDIKVRFFPEYAPKAVENFVTHAKEGYYDGLTFHRVIQDFMIQGGDPSGDGTGGESIWGEPFEVEATPYLKHIKGALCMAKSSEEISIGSQFYIVQNENIDDETKEVIQYIIDNQDADSGIEEGTTNKEYFPAELMQAYLKYGGYPGLDFGYTVFGQVYEGLDVVDKIAAVETDENDKPETDVIINKITVSEY